MNDWLWILALVGLVLWNLSLQANNKRLEQRIYYQAQEIYNLREQVNGGAYQQNGMGCLGILLWLSIAALIALILLGVSL
jgi:multisubunit Na+/H+ antiporter MnhB subunit